ncbi:MAG: DinB family protein [Chloroflexota bacterium]|nr:DinB family protein [Chloroflexota bacterium]
METDKAFREQLLHLLRGGNAHLSFDEAVADFPPDAINQRPPNVPYTPWHLLEHLRLAQWDILDFIRNPDYQAMKWPDDYWPAPDAKADTAAWEQTISAFRADLKAIEDLVNEPQTELTAAIPHGDGQTILREILLVADHNAYHIGEFAILRQVMGTWNKQRAMSNE